jgi:hypothetical protein
MGRKPPCCALGILLLFELLFIFLGTSCRAARRAMALGTAISRGCLGQNPVWGAWQESCRCSQSLQTTARFFIQFPHTAVSRFFSKNAEGFVHGQPAIAILAFIALLKREGISCGPGVLER